MKFRLITAIITLFITTFSVFLAPQLAYACDGSACLISGSNDAGGITSKTPPQPTLADRIRTIVNVLLYLLGAIAVVMIVVGGVRYVTSGGEGQAISGAKNTILYAVVGLVVAILAYAIVNFVVSSFIK